jgi:hypothetical protein
MNPELDKHPFPVYKEDDEHKHEINHMHYSKGGKYSQAFYDRYMNDIGEGQKKYSKIMRHAIKDNKFVNPPNPNNPKAEKGYLDMLKQNEVLAKQRPQAPHLPELNYLNYAVKVADPVTAQYAERGDGKGNYKPDPLIKDPHFEKWAQLKGAPNPAFIMREFMQTVNNDFPSMTFEEMKAEIDKFVNSADNRWSEHPYGQKIAAMYKNAAENAVNAMAQIDEARAEEEGEELNEPVESLEEPASPVKTPEAIVKEEEKAPEPIQPVVIQQPVVKPVVKPLDKPVEQKIAADMPSLTPAARALISSITPEPYEMIKPSKELLGKLQQAKGYQHMNIEDKKKLVESKPLKKTVPEDIDVNPAIARRDKALEAPMPKPDIVDKSHDTLARAINSAKSLDELKGNIDAIDALPWGAKSTELMKMYTSKQDQLEKNAKQKPSSVFMPRLENDDKVYKHLARVINNAQSVNELDANVDAIDALPWGTQRSELMKLYNSKHDALGKRQAKKEYRSKMLIEEEIPHPTRIGNPDTLPERIFLTDQQIDKYTKMVLDPRNKNY